MGLTTIVALRRLASFIARYPTPYDAQAREGAILGEEIGRLCNVDSRDTLERLWIWRSKGLTEEEILAKLKDRINYKPQKTKRPKSISHNPEERSGGGIIFARCPEWGERLQSSEDVDEEEDEEEVEDENQESLGIESTSTPSAPQDDPPKVITSTPRATPPEDGGSSAPQDDPPKVITSTPRAAPPEEKRSLDHPVVFSHKLPRLWKEDLFFAYRIAVSCESFAVFIAQRDALKIDQDHEIDIDIWSNARKRTEIDRESAFDLFVRDVLRMRLEALDRQIRRIQTQKSLWEGVLLLKGEKP